MPKKYYLVEIDVPVNVLLKFIRQDLKEAAINIRDNYDEPGLAKPKVRRLTKAQFQQLENQ